MTMWYRYHISFVISKINVMATSLYSVDKVISIEYRKKQKEDSAEKEPFLEDLDLKTTLHKLEFIFNHLTQN